MWDTSSIQDQAGNMRMMRGYLDNGEVDTTTVTASGSPTNANRHIQCVRLRGRCQQQLKQTGICQISGAGITTTSTTPTRNSNFNGIFTQGTASIPVGNYVVLTNPNVLAFALSAIPSIASTPYKRAALNGIQIVPR